MRKRKDRRIFFSVSMARALLNSTTIETIACNVRRACVNLYSLDDTAIDFAGKMATLKLRPISNAACAAADTKDA